MLPQRQEIASVVVCEDDEVTLDLLCDHLVADRFGVLPAPSASDALRLCRYNQPDLLLLDLSLPDASGLDVLREIREADGLDSRFDPQLPVIILSGRGAQADRVRGLVAGADDYLAKPFDLDELLARLRALLRRTKNDDGPNGDAVQLVDLRLDPTSRRVWRGEREIELSKTEFDLLELLLRNQGMVLDHSTIYDRIWGYDFGPDSKNLAVYISYLRRKLELPGESKLIHTVRGVGYSARSS
jgi:two-component system response regulator MprA